MVQVEAGESKLLIFETFSLIYFLHERVIEELALLKIQIEYTKIVFYTICPEMAEKKQNHTPLIDQISKRTHIVLFALVCQNFRFLDWNKRRRNTCAEL